MGGLAVGTIVAKNFLSFARVLARSFREHHPDVPFFVVLADHVGGEFDPAVEPFEIIPLDALGIPDLRGLCFQYSRPQVSIAAKPHLLSHLLDRGFTSVVFLDADILVVSPLDPLLAATAAHAVVLTPHLLSSLSGPDRITRELNVLQSGVYNGGFIGVSAHESARQFLSWWKNRLHTHCRHDVPEGMHYDQRWLDLVPALFDDVFVVHDAGCNVAHWNLPERDVAASCRFFHFSGFEPERAATITRYSSRLTFDAVAPEVALLFERYVQLLEMEDYWVTRDWPYAFADFDNGVAIPDLARRIYRELDPSVAAAFGDPFQTAGSASYFRWLNEPAGGSEGQACRTRLWEAVYRSRPDLQNAFPDLFGADRSSFQHWIITSGLGEHKIPEAFAPKLAAFIAPSTA